MDTDRSIREAIRLAMRERNITQQELADLTDMQQPSIARLLAGERGKIPDSLLRVLDALELELAVQERKN
ncbi:MAG TPA: helix-turn-helix transcriptional regulator [Trueperaceae bacterium]